MIIQKPHLKQRKKSVWSYHKNITNLGIKGYAKYFYLSTHYSTYITLNAIKMYK